MSGNTKRIIPFIILLIIAVIAAVTYFVLIPKSDPQDVLENIIKNYNLTLPEEYEGSDALIADRFEELFSVEIIGETEQSFRNASTLIRLSYLDIEEMTADMGLEIQEQLALYVSQAKRHSEVYTDDNSFLPELVKRAYEEVLNRRLEKAADYIDSINISADMVYNSEGWKLTGGNDFIKYIPITVPQSPDFEEISHMFRYVDLTYKLPDWTSPGPEANPACYGEAMDPAVISELLESPAAKRLINGQQLNWNPDIELIPDSPIRYYLDETLLTIVWQESEHGAIGTFAETFIADASQLRRKLADDTFGGQTFYYPTVLAKQSNAVLALSGDFYDLPSRVYGLYVYDGELLRYNLSAGQSCLFTDKGDMIFTYENQFATVEEAQQFIKDNNIMFSLSFGPVLIEKGVDKTPFDYPIGEIRDTYARCAVGQLGERHYLSMTINVRVPDYNVYVTLRQAADSMIEHGCYNAYTLDGGQTGSIVLGGELINPVQFGFEREQSDIFYFATAIPNE